MPLNDHMEQPSFEDGHTGRDSRELALELSDHVRRLLSKEHRTPDDDETMAHAAHAAAFFWLESGNLLNEVRADWLLARVYAVLVRPEPALHYARRCFRLMKAEEIRDVDRAYAYEAMARGYAVANHVGDARNYFQKALRAGRQIVDDEDRRLFSHDLHAEPWFGLDPSEELLPDEDEGDKPTTDS